MSRFVTEGTLADSPPKVEIRVGVRYGTHVDGFELAIDPSIPRQSLRLIVKAVGDELAGRIRQAVDGR
jgi:hypothetical protein